MWFELWEEQVAQRGGYRRGGAGRGAAAEARGVDASKKDIDDLFSSWDADGGGSLDFGELKKILTSATRSGSADAKKRAESQKIVEGQKGEGKPKAEKLRESRG